MDGSLIVYDKEREDAAFNPNEEMASSSSEVASAAGKRVNYTRQLNVVKSVYSKNQKANPVALWKVSNQRTNAFAFSPDSRHLAVVSEDGTLRIIDYLRERYAPAPFLPVPSVLTPPASSTSSTRTTAGSRASAGPPTASTSSRAGRTTSSPSGPSPSRPSWRGARATSRGCRPWPSTRGGATTGTTASAAWARTAGCACGTLTSGCCTGPRR